MKEEKKRSKGGILDKGSSRQYYLHKTNEKNAREENYGIKSIRKVKDKKGNIHEIKGKYLNDKKDF